MSKNSLEEELRDNIYRLKLKMLKESLYKRQPYQDYVEGKSRNNHKIMTSTPQKDFKQELKMEQIEMELAEGRKKYEMLKLKLKHQKMEKTITSSVIQSMNKKENQSTDKFTQFMEMMILQQNQTQSLLMNQLMFKNQQEKPQFTFLPYTTNSNPTIDINTSFPYVNPQLPHINPPFPVTTISKPLPQINKKENTFQPYPGNTAQQELRRLGFAMLFCSILEDHFQDQSLFLTDSFLFEIKIKEIINIIEKIYTNPSGEIFKLLNSLLTQESPNVKILISRTGTNEELAYAEKELNFVLQNVGAKIAEIMPPNGTLGCDCKSILSEYFHNKQKFPENYFFNVEKILLQIDSNNIIHNVGFTESQLLLIGMFIVRTLVMHVLMKSVEYNLCSSLTTTGQENLRLLASLFMSIYQSILVDFIGKKFPNEIKRKTMNIEFSDISASFLSDSELQPLLKVVKKSMDYVKTVILKWSESYVMKLRPV